MMTLPETWAWDDFDMLTVEDERQAQAAAKGANLAARQRDKVAEALAFYTCDSVHLED